MEAAFLQADPVLEKFAKNHAINLSKNYHNWPERSLRWSRGKLKPIHSASYAVAEAPTS